VSYSQIVLSHETADALDVSDAIDNFPLKTGPIDVGVYQRHVEFLKLECESVHIRTQLFAVDVVEWRWVRNLWKRV